MDLTNRGVQPTKMQTPAPSKDTSKMSKKSVLATSIALLFSATILVAAVAVYLVVGNNSTTASKTELDYVKTDTLQAVYLTADQIWFGNIQDIDNKVIVMTNVYYLQAQQAAAGQTGTNLSLAKLGCGELHKPEDEMIINREQVIFWENLKTDSQVSTAVQKYLEENKNGECPATTTTNKQP